MLHVFGVPAESGYGARSGERPGACCQKGEATESGRPGLHVQLC